MNIQLAFVLFIVVALVGWGIAELKGRMTFVHSEEEKKEAEEIEEHNRANGFREMDLKDLLEHNSTKGYDAI